MERLNKLKIKIEGCTDLGMLRKYRTLLYNIRNTQLSLTELKLKQSLLFLIKEKSKDEDIINLAFQSILTEWAVLGYAWRYTNLNKKETPDILFYQRDKDDTYYKKTILFSISTLSYYTNHYITINEHRLITKLIKFYKRGKFYEK